MERGIQKASGSHILLQQGVSQIIIRFFTYYILTAEIGVIRMFDMRVYVQSELAQEKIVGACDDQETTFSGLDGPTGSSFKVCAYGNDLDLLGCKTAVNGPESEPERVIIRVS